MEVIVKDELQRTCKLVWPIIKILS